MTSRGGWVDAKLPDSNLVDLSKGLFFSRTSQQQLRPSRSSIRSLYTPFKANNWYHLCFLVERPDRSTPEMGRQRWDPGNRIVQFDQLGFDLPAGVLNKHPPANTQISIPPGRIQSPRIGSHSKLDIAMGIRFLGYGLQFSCKSINMTNDNPNTVSRSVAGGNRKGNQGRTIAGDVVFSTMLQLGVPRITFRKLREACRFEPICEVLNCVENGRVCIDEVQKGLRIVLGAYF